MALIYLYTTLFLFFCHVPTTIITRPWKRMIHSLSQLLHSRFSQRVLSFAWAAFVITLILATVFSLPEKTESPRERRLIAVFGFFVFIFVLFSTSTVKKRLDFFYRTDVCYSIARRFGGTRSVLPFSFNSYSPCLSFEHRLVMISFSG